MNKTRTLSVSPLLDTYRENPVVSFMWRHLLLTAYYLSHGEGHEEVSYSEHYQGIEDCFFSAYI